MEPVVVHLSKYSLKDVKQKTKHNTGLKLLKTLNNDNHNAWMKPACKLDISFSLSDYGFQFTIIRTTCL